MATGLRFYCENFWVVTLLEFSVFFLVLIIIWNSGH